MEFASQKLVWVGLPLLVAALLWLGLWLAGRRPSRLALNVASSLLLLGYLLATAGLGIFWVANQQLPVFDWHYLFGYATLALLLLHLGFNLRVVWRALSRWREPARASRLAPPAAADGQRRRWLHWGAALAAVVGAYGLGRRQGRAEGRMPTQASGVLPPDAEGVAVVDRLHAATSHSRQGVWQAGPAVAWGDAPPAFKQLSGQRLSLPPPGPPRPGEALAAIGALLWHTTGISARRGGLMLRCSPSSGALFSTELYLVSRALPGVPPGVWHHDPATHALTRLASWPSDPAALAAATGDATLTAPGWLLASAVFRRTGHKYRDRAHRYLWADLGHALENLRQAAPACGWQAHLARAFDTRSADQLLGLDGQEESVLAAVALCTPGQRAPTPPAGQWRPEPLPSTPALGWATLAHAASSLRWHAGPQTLPPPAMPAPAVHAEALRLIAARRSVRRFANSPLSQPQLQSLLDAAMQPAGLLSPALKLDVVVNAVDGLAPGAYRWQPGRTLQLRRRAPSLREAAQAAALDQDVIGGAAVVVVLSADRGTLGADPLGPARGYRHAFLEAGLVGERLYLQAQAQGLGGCAVGAFYDDEAAALVGLAPADEWPLHFMALGVPA